MPLDNDATLDEVLDKFMDQENLTRLEGRKGVENLCTIARAIGYKDPQYYGQLTHKAAIGDLIMMLEDNSGMIEAMLEWMKDRNVQEWNESLREQLQEEAESDTD